MDRGDEFTASWQDYFCFEAESKEDLVLKLLYLVEEKLKEFKKVKDFYKLSREEKANLKSIIYNERFYLLDFFLDENQNILNLEIEIETLEEWFEKNRGYATNNFYV